MKFIFGLVFLAIILLALSFGIINTMLMAVLERGREIGMLMAIGMNKFRLFGMIFLETLMLVLLAAPIGLLLAYLLITYFGEVGLDFSDVYDEGYAALGFKSLIYPLCTKRNRMMFKELNRDLKKNYSKLLLSTDLSIDI